METFHLYHLAACWGGRSVVSKVLSTPLTTGPVNPIISEIHPIHPAPLVSQNSVIRAAAVHMVFASRKSQDFITPKQVEETENWTSQVRLLHPPPSILKWPLTCVKF
jgi:uridine phosphorylase